MTNDNHINELVNKNDVATENSAAGEFGYDNWSTNHEPVSAAASTTSSNTSAISTRIVSPNPTAANSCFEILKQR